MYKISSKQERLVINPGKRSTEFVANIRKLSMQFVYNKAAEPIN